MLRATKADSPRRSKRQYLEGTRPELVKAASQFWWALQDLNLGPTDYESAALTAELRARATAILLDAIYQADRSTLRALPKPRRLRPSLLRLFRPRYRLQNWRCAPPRAPSRPPRAPS